MGGRRLRGDLSPSARQLTGQQPHQEPGQLLPAGPWSLLCSLGCWAVRCTAGGLAKPRAGPTPAATTGHPPGLAAWLGAEHVRQLEMVLLSWVEAPGAAGLGVGTQREGAGTRPVGGVTGCAGPESSDLWVHVRWDMASDVAGQSRPQGPACAQQTVGAGPAGRWRGPRASGWCTEVREGSPRACQLVLWPDAPCSARTPASKHHHCGRVSDLRLRRPTATNRVT